MGGNILDSNKLCAVGQIWTKPIQCWYPREQEKMIDSVKRSQDIAETLYFNRKQLHENASVEEIRKEQITFLSLIKLDSSNRKIYLHYCLW